MTALKISNLSKSFFRPNSQVPVLYNLSLDIPEKSFTVVLGRSGCGKTTLLRIIAGLEKATSGEIIFDTPIQKMGFVFQEARLMPWLTVAENLSFLQKDISEEKLSHILRLLKLEDFAHFYPREISGGMAQKTAIGRALCYESDIILMDEPFASLDYFTRNDLQQELSQIFENLSKTVIFVTHNIEEAILLADSIIVLNSGKTAHILSNTEDPIQRRRPDYQTQMKQKILELL